MIVDSKSIDHDQSIETDVCIIGAGVSGLTLAHEFADQELRVLLLEGGGMEPDSLSQSLFWGENIGHPYYPLDTARISGVGGSAHRWNIDLMRNGSFGVRLHPLDELDFQEREWVPNSGWPFDKSHLDPFYERAHAFCKIGPYTYDPVDWETPQETWRLPFSGDRVKTTIFQFAERSTFLDERLESLKSVENIRILTYAHVTRLKTDESAGTVKSVDVTSYSGHSFSIESRLFILASGAIETPRLMLLSNQVLNCGLGNQHDLVGRFFMEHPHLWAGRFYPANPSVVGRTGLYRIHWAKGTPVMGKIAIGEDVQRSEGILNTCVSIHPEVYKPRPNAAPSWPVISWPLLQARGHAENLEPAGAFGSFCREARKAFGRAYRSLKKPGVHFRLNQMSEQMPNPDSRVVLSGEKDVFGRNRVQLNWQLTALDLKTIARSQRVLDEELRKAGLGRLEVISEDELLTADVHGGWHHMGTTRMHGDPKKGVVDRDSRVHGLSNLFIAGSSVFPTGGYANPVLTTVALCMRLADHVKSLI